jgi:epoxyqueuosine reductase
VLIAAGNSGDFGLVPLVEERLGDPQPLVRGSAVWALRRLDPARADALAAVLCLAEPDPVVRQEWTASVTPIRVH